MPTSNKICCELGCRLTLQPIAQVDACLFPARNTHWTITNNSATRSQQPWHCKRYTHSPHHSPSSDVGIGRASSGVLAAFLRDILGVLALVFSASSGILVRAFESVSRYLGARRERRGRGRSTNEACTEIGCHSVTRVATIRHTRVHGKLAHTFLYTYILQATTVGPVHAHTR